MSDKIREDFEKWAATHEYLGGVPLHRGCRGDYADIDLQHAFDAWQASRESLVIELPKPYAVVGDYAACGGGRLIWDVEYAEKIDDPMCAKTPVYDRASLEAAGLKVKS